MNKIKAYRITVRCWLKHHQEFPTESYSWGPLRIELVLKWNWYFEYRLALLRIKYPRAKVLELQRIEVEPDTRTERQLLENNVSRRRGELTKFLNKVAKAKEAYDKSIKQEASTIGLQMFGTKPFEELEGYDKVKAKEFKKRAELIEAETALNQHIKDHEQD